MQRIRYIGLMFGWLLAGLAASAADQGAEVRSNYATLRENEVVHGFCAVAVYLDDTDRRMGARFRHERTGFTLDLLEIPSVPQAFTWVTTFPTSDKGEPHTQEHLLLGKGNKGRAHANQEPMRLVNSSAFTMQWRTIYHFHTTAGTEAFFEEFEQSYDALLHPDYTDEEIRREVRNFGVSHADDQSLRLEEKGTVYNEMVTSMDLPAWRLWRASARAVYGATHPLAFNSGGDPAALRVLSPEDIRRFHADHYFLRNMGTVMALAPDVKLADALARLDAILARLEPHVVTTPVQRIEDLPPPEPAASGEIQYVAYPSRDAQQAADVHLVWPAERDLDPQERILCELFCANLASDPTSTLYKRFIDSRTREWELGAQSVDSYVSDELGAPISIIFGDVPASRRNEVDLADLRKRVRAELARIAGWPEGSAELAEFNARLASRLIARGRETAKLVNSPPGFGFRGTRAGWMQQLDEINRAPGFEKSITQKADAAAIKVLLESPANPWRERLAQWRLLESTPLVLAARPVPELVHQEQEARGRRIAAEIARLAQRYAVDDEQAVLERYEREYDEATTALAAAERELEPPRFITDPPLTLDDQLEYEVTQIDAGVPLVTSTFDSMTSGYVGLVLRLDGIPEEQLVYLSMLPELLTGVGVIENGRASSFEEMSERLRREILGLEARFRTDLRTRHVDLVLRGAGNDAAETRRALDWMQLVLHHPDFRPENLARIRDLVDQTYAALRNTMKNREEAWVNDPANAYRAQENPLYLSAASFLTRAHHVFRLRWMLKDPGCAPEERVSVASILGDLATVRGDRQALHAYLQQLDVAAGKDSERVHRIVVEIRNDLQQLLPDLPDESLAADWAYLCERMRLDFAQGPAATLQALDAVRRSLLRSGGARLFQVGSRATQAEIAEEIKQLAATLDRAPFEAAAYGTVRRIDVRLQARDATATAPRFVGLLNHNSQGGVFLHSAPATSYLMTDDDAVLDYLATNLFGGGGAHGVFMQTWAAGLAYSNGLRGSLAQGTLNYYAERTPELPVTLRFVIDYLQKTAPKPEYVEHAIAGAFGASRAGANYETRGEAIAHDLFDGLTPDVIARFRRAVLDLRERGNLAAELFARANQNYARVLPGMLPDVNLPAGAVYFVIGPEKQFAAHEAYLRHQVDPDARLHRLYPRDFWLVD